MILRSAPKRSTLRTFSADPPYPPSRHSMHRRTPLHPLTPILAPHRIPTSPPPKLASQTTITRKPPCPSNKSRTNLTGFSRSSSISITVCQVTSIPRLRRACLPPPLLGGTIRGPDRAGGLSRRRRRRRRCQMEAGWGGTPVDTGRGCNERETPHTERDYAAGRRSRDTNCDLSVFSMSL
jgi:hypothetical protein